MEPTIVEDTILFVCSGGKDSFNVQIWDQAKKKFSQPWDSRQFFEKNLSQLFLEFWKRINENIGQSKKTGNDEKIKLAKDICKPFLFRFHLFFQDWAT